MDKKLTKEENNIVEAETIKLRMKTPEERRAFIQGRITGIKTVLHLIRGELMERIGILHEAEVDLLENNNAR